MAETNIEWCDRVWNPVTGCSKVSPGCAHCYAETVAHRLWGKQYGFIDVGEKMPRTRVFTDVMTHADRLDQPLRWKKPARVFVNSMSDLFHEDAPDHFIDQVFAVMALAPQHTFQVLTKRVDRMRSYVVGLAGRLGELWDLTNQPTWIELPAGRSFPRYPENWPLPNVWLGVSVENQLFADERIPLLLETPAEVRFVSAEPLLGPIDFVLRGDRIADWDEDWRYNVLSGEEWAGPRAEDPERSQHLNWVIVGGESGAKARPFNVAWARSIVQQCQAADVPVFVKQLGRDVRDRNDAGFMGDEPEHWPEIMAAEDRIEHDLDGTRDGYQGAPVRVHLKNLKGGDPAEWPEDLRIRQFPELKGQNV